MEQIAAFFGLMFIRVSVCGTEIIWLYNGVFPVSPKANIIKKAKALASKITSISLERLTPSSGQPRSNFNDEKILELASSLAVHGVLQPILVRKIEGERYEIVAGERRFRAARIARLEKIPCIVMDLKNDQSMAIALVENIQREDLNPIEEAQAYQKLKEALKLSQDEVAERVGKDRASIANTLRLLRLPKAIQDMVVNEELSMGHARALLSLDSSDMMMMVAKKALREGLSVRRVEGIIRAMKGGFWVGEEKKRNAYLISDPLEREIQQKMEYELASKVELKKENAGYVVTIRFHSPEQLNLMLERLGIEI